MNAPKSYNWTFKKMPLKNIFLSGNAGLHEPNLLPHISDRESTHTLFQGNRLFQ